MTESDAATNPWNGAQIGRVAGPLRQKVVSALREAIVRYEFKPGHRLVERELVEQLVVSRTTVREALRELVTEGLITVVPQKGAFVSASTRTDAADIYEIRAALESVLVKNFVERATGEQVARLEAAVDDLEEAMSLNDVRELLARKDRFYAVLHQGASSSVLQLLLEMIHRRVQMLRAASLSNEGRPSVMVAEIRAIADAIAKRDPERAASLCRDHIRSAAQGGLKPPQITPGEPA